MKTKRLKLLMPTIVALFLATLIGGCKDENVEKVGVCPIVVSTIPIRGAVDVPLNQVISATFNEKMKPSTMTNATFTLAGSEAIIGTVTYSGITVSLTPTSNLAPFSTYTGLVKASVKDLMGNALQADYTWTFTTIPEVTLSSNPITGGTTSGAGTFAQGSPVTVTATPNTGYVFFNWTYLGAIVSTNASYQFTMAGNRALVANFTSQYALSLSSSPAAGGTTGGAGSYTAGSSVIVTATPNTGYTFVNWTDNGVVVSTSASYTFLINANKTLVANFLLNTYTLNVTATNGTVVKNPVQATYNHGITVALIATPNAGYTFTGWSDGATGATNPLTVTMDANKNITANFAQITYTLAVITINGSVAKVPTQTTYNSGATVMLTPTPNTGYTFTSWSGDATGSTNPLTVTMDANKNITANYTLNTYTLNVTAINGTVVKNPNQTTFNSGSTVSLTATPNAGYAFTSWSGDITGSSNPSTMTMNANKNITANFTVLVVPPTIALGSAANFGTFGGNAGITNQGLNTIINNGGIGTTAASSLITGFHDGLTADVYTQTPLNVGNSTGGIFTAPPAPGTAVKAALATQALLDATAAYISMSPANKPGGVDPGAGELGGLTLAPGIYKAASGTFKITNLDLVLDAQGNANAVWIFQTAAGLTVGIPSGARTVRMINGGLPKNVFWYVGSAAVINYAGGGTMVGTIIANSGVTFSSPGVAAQTVLNGRAISLVSSVTMVNTTINNQ
jgi:uncharacterized repeat protein (TIGR02543 family)